MKKTVALGLIACVILLCLSACGGGAGSTSVPAVSSAAPATSAPTAPAPSAPASTPAASVPATRDLAATVANLAAAANLGNTIAVSQIDLKAGGVNMDNVEAFDGAESQLSAQNGGIVIVIKAVAGTAQTVAEEMGGYRDYRLGNADYEEFEDARTNTMDARITVFGDYVVYAVSATGLEGGWAQLDDAIVAEFA